MTVELSMLFWTVVLAAGQMVVAVLLTMTKISLPELAGNRDDLPSADGMAGRAKRAHTKMLESLPLFAILILVAHVAGLTNEQTALGAQIFLGARLVYAIVYLVGIPWVRTGIWGVSVIGMIMIALPILAG